MTLLANPMVLKYQAHPQPGPELEPVKEFSSLHQYPLRRGFLTVISSPYQPKINVLGVL